MTASDGPPWPFGKYTAQPRPETLLRDFIPWQDMILPDQTQERPPEKEYLSPQTKFRIRQLIAQDLTFQQISARLGISVARIRGYARHYRWGPKRHLYHDEDL